MNTPDLTPEPSQIERTSFEPITLESVPILRTEYGLNSPFHKDLGVNGQLTVGHFGPAKIGCTYWEQLRNVDVLGPEYDYNEMREIIVVDWDDTIKDTGRFWVQAHREVLRDFNFTEEETNDDSILKLFGNIHVADTLGLDRFVEDGVQLTDDDIWVRIKSRAAEILREDPIDPLIIEALKVAKAMGALIPVWSSSPRELIEAAIEVNNIPDLFTAIVSVDDVDSDKHKPNPQGFLMAVKACDVIGGYLQPDEAYSDEKPLVIDGLWMVGDSPNDILGAKALGKGVATVWLETTLHGHNVHEKRETMLSKLERETRREAVLEAVHTLRPTLTARTFDPEEAKYGRNVPLSKMSKQDIQGLSTSNYNLARFLMLKNDRALLHRAEAVREALLCQGIEANPMGLDKRVGATEESEQTQDLVNGVIYGGKGTSGTYRIGARPKTSNPVRTMSNILARSEGPYL